MFTDQFSRLRYEISRLRLRLLADCDLPKITGLGVVEDVENFLGFTGISQGLLLDECLYMWLQLLEWQVCVEF